ncbi:MAG: phosphatidate cytidylyltransferase [Gemmatimonadales bacterium]|nr:phosphatidate cytidylyltransferase [Gemmatimonadales bacterium]
MNSELVRRIGFAVVAIPLALLIIWYGGLPLAVLLALVGALGSGELFRLAELGGVRPARLLGMATAAAVPLLAHLVLTRPAVAAAVADLGLHVAALWLLLLLTWALAARPAAARPLEAVSVTLLGVAYTGGLPAFLLLIRHGQLPQRSWAGAWLVFFPLVVTWVCDTAAMFGGRALGGPKLAPTVSPGKTRSGATAGVIGALAVAPVFSAWIFPRVGIDMRLWQAVVVAAALSVVGQVGDLAESLFKRQAGVKDSSHLIPGHGGVLDRLDSLYFVVPAAAAMYRFFGVI